MPEFTRSAGARDVTAIPLAAWLLLHGLLLGIYVLLAQRTFYLHDGLQIVYTHLGTGNLSHPRHPLYLPPADLFVRALDFTGAALHTRAVWFSAACTTGAAAFAGVFARQLGLPPARQLALVLAFALAPATVFFATVVEFHALFLLCATASFALAEHVHRSSPRSCARRRTLLAAGLGLLTWTAAMTHSTGNLLLAPIAVLWLARSRLRERVLEIASMTTVHVALLLLATPLLHEALGRAGLPERPGEWLEKWFHPAGAVLRFFEVCLFELLWGLLPASLAVLLLRRASRAQFVWILLGLLPYLLLCTLILADADGNAIRERGAYLLPWLLPGTALLVVHWPGERLRHPRTIATLALALLATLSTTLVRLHDERPGRAFGDAVRSLTSDRPAWILCGRREDLEAVLLECPRAHALMITSLVTKSAEQLLTELPAFGSVIEQQQDAGLLVLVSEDVFRDVPGTPPPIQRNIELLRNWLRTRFFATARKSGSFSFYLLQKR